MSMFMNNDDIDEAVVGWDDGEHPNLLAAARTLSNLRDMANANSDGWAYWPKPSRAAAQLMALVDRWRHRWELPDITTAELRRALTPVKTFRTRTGIHFHIEGDKP